VIRTTGTIGSLTLATLGNLGRQLRSCHRLISQRRLFNHGISLGSGVRPFASAPKLGDQAAVSSMPGPRPANHSPAVGGIRGGRSSGLQTNFPLSIHVVIRFFEAGDLRGQ